MKKKSILETSAANIIAQMRLSGSPDVLAGAAHFGIPTHKRFGIRMPVLRRLARDAGRNHRLAMLLWKSGYPEARIIASMVGEPQVLTGDEMETMVNDFDAWDVCDATCMNLFRNSPLAHRKIMEWAGRNKEFVKRAAFALIASLTWDKNKCDDRVFLEYLPVIAKASEDDRNFVKKAVNWALRNIGKRNPRLNNAAILTAKKIQLIDAKTPRWVAADAIRELESRAVQDRLNGMV